MLETTITVIATILSLEGGFARLDHDVAALLAPGDEAVVYRVGDVAGCWQEVGRGVVVEAGAGPVLALSGAAPAAGDRAFFDLPVERVGGTTELTGEHLRELDDDTLADAVMWLVPEDPRVELAVLRLLEARWRERGDTLGVATDDVSPAPPVPAPAEVDAAADPATRDDAPPPIAAIGADGRPELEEPTTTGLTARVRDWASAWSSQRVDDYLAFYSRDFRPANGQSYAAWVADRRERLRRPAFIEVVIDRLDARVTGVDQAVATFVQHYRSDSYRDTVEKRLELVWEDDDWRILREVVATP